MRLFVSERRSHVVIASIIFPMMAAGLLMYGSMFVYNASGIRQDAGQIGGVIARGIMAKQIQPSTEYSAEEFPKVNREAKRSRADWAPPYYGKVLSFDHSKVI